ncbi:collagen binding domain-containing protein [Microbacterium sp. Leaf159]|uniref:MSCRAMM family protein n=1 Tax=Microbacterium sp. Leaf159 TaxID=1736279 RepID=UPI0009E9902D|nr:carboxypeptidase-like regulatory domain-containing protein [Microbacterium sp. Leaf159]
MARRRAFIRAAVSGAVAFALALGGATAAVAEDADPPAAAGTISGTVTRGDDGSAVAGVGVSASGDAGGWGYATTDADGRYTIEALADDSYVISFMPDGTDLKREYWQNTSDYDAATRIVIAGANAEAGIDAALERGGAIVGAVTRADDGSAVVGAGIQALDERNEIVGQTESDASGAYSLDGLPAGAYRVRFGSPDPALVSEYWKDSYSWDGATLVVVAGTESVTAVDAQLDGVGYVSGTVTKSADGSPVRAAVLLYDVNNSVEDPYVDTDSEGNYRIAVIPGTYRVLFHAYETGVLEEYWEGTREWDDATFVTVGSNEEIEGISAELEVVSTVSGTVTLDSDEGHDVVVEAWADGALVRSTEADPASGAYTLNVPEGTYVLKASATFPGSTTTAAPQYFDGVSTAAEATPVVAVGRSTLTGIDFDLVAVTAPIVDPAPALTISAPSVRAGGVITVSGTGFVPGESIAFELHSDPIALGSLVADADGRIGGTLRIPASAAVGSHTLVALRGGVPLQTSATLQVTAAVVTGAAVEGAAVSPPRGLAATGGELPTTALLTGLFLALAGTVLVRRRRAHS